ncbi:hypothetical protein FRC11_011988 [Ceratobasidium sp. 423]|nr:hypothetical protein FRC11_011988 [Ceratobasidium sp. 423]
MLTSVVGGLTTSEGDAPIITLRKCTNRWLQLVSLVLTHHSGGKILLDSSLLMKLLGSMRDAVQPMLLSPPERGSSSDVDMSTPIEFVTPFAYRIPVTYHSDDLMMGPLGSIVGVLLMPLDTSDDLQLQINRNAVAAYSSLAPVVLRRILGDDAEPDTQFIALQDSKPSSLEECMYIVVRCMMLTLDCLLKDRYRQHVLRLEGRLLSMVGAALALVSGSMVKDHRSTPRDTGALDALREHHILNELLDDHIVGNRYCFPGELDSRAIQSLITTATCALKDNLRSSNNFISPSKIPILIQLAVDISDAPSCVGPLLAAVAELLSPIQLFSDSFRAEFLLAFTVHHKGFLTLMKLTSKKEYHSSVWDIIAHILSLAADTDIDSNELEPHSVDGAELYQAILKVLEAVIWALEHQNPISAEDESVPEFFTAERIQEVIKKLAEMKNTPSAGKSPGRDLVTNLPEQTGPSTKPAEQAETTGGSVLRATQTVADVEHIDEPPPDVNAGDMVENGGEDEMQGMTQERKEMLRT